MLLLALNLAPGIYGQSRSTYDPRWAFGLVAALRAAEAPSTAAPPNTWAEILDAAKRSPEQQDACRTLVEIGRRAAQRPIVQRVYRLEDVGKHRTWLDGRSRVLEDVIREKFALAMSDQAATSVLSNELPIIASAYRLSGEEALRKRVVEQLSEMATWSPIQRPGWTLYAPGHRLPADGKDGNWLATGLGVRAIADPLEIMPPGSVDPAVRARLDSLLLKEIDDIVEDWKVRRPWFVRSDDARTNQWALPTEGLIRACLTVGRDKRPDAYELGVRNLLQAFAAHSPGGEFDEGITYAVFTMTSMVNTSRAMALAGDRRALEQPFLRNFITWMVHDLQPGRWLINCFDAYSPIAPRGNQEAGDVDLEKVGVISSMPFQRLLSLCAVTTGSPVARWALQELFAGPSDDVAGLGTRILPPVGTAAAPPLYASYARATRVNWRDNWADNGSGVWVRGGNALDGHDHQDRGHVNFIFQGRPVLIEAGTPSYDTRQMMTLYASGVGHNVLQIGTAFPEGTNDRQTGDYVRLPGWQKPGCVAPITVRKLDKFGGAVRVTGATCYERLDAWYRDVAWDAGHVTVNDHVALASGEREVILFRWHLGTTQPAAILGKGGDYTITWPGAALTLRSRAPLSVTQEMLPDHTLVAKDWDDFKPNLHTCITVRTVDRVESLDLVSCAAGAARTGCKENR